MFASEPPDKGGVGKRPSPVRPAEGGNARLQELQKLEAENARLRALLGERDARLAELVPPPDSGGSSSSTSVPKFPVSSKFPVVGRFSSSLQQLDEDFQPFLAGNFAVAFPPRGSSPTATTRIWPQAGSNCTLPDFRRWLTDVGIDIAKFSSKSGIVGKTVEDIHRQVLRGESWFSVGSDGGVVHHIEMVKLYLVAMVAGEEQFLIEQDRFDIANGKQRTIMLPMAKKMRAGESWREAARRALHEQVGVSDEWQGRFLDLEEESYFFAEDLEMSNDCPDLQVSLRMHEVLVRVRSANSPEEQAALDRIGLPAGRDFVLKEEGEDGLMMLHVWCWKSREYERNARLKAFGNYLTAHGVDISLFGADDSQRTLFQFYLEVKEKKTCSLRIVPEGPTKGLQRIVRLVRIRMITEVHKMKRLLVECDRMWDDGRHRQQKNKLLVKKMKESDDWRLVLRQTLHVKLGIEESVQDECFEVDLNEEYSEEVMPSKGYAGIPSLYKMTTVTLNVIDPNHPALEKIGLPRGNDFLTKEVTKYTTGTLHIWNWAPLGREDTEANLYTGTALEELTQGLYDAESLVQSTASHPQTESIGLGKPLRRALEKLRHCSAKLYNIDATLAEVDVGSLMGITRSRSLTQDDKVIADFIADNFTRPRQREQSRSGENISRASRRLPTGDSVGDSANSEEGGQPLRPLRSSDCRSPQMSLITKGLDDWKLDLFQVDKTTSRRALESYGHVVLVPLCRLCLQCDDVVVRNFLREVTAAYRRNPYHNALHAAQVTHSASWLARALGIHEEQSHLEAASFLLACITHDVGHIGRNNAFCVTTEHSLALLYNDVKVLENMHSAHCFELLQKSEMLKGLSRSDRGSLRSQIIEYILATDMAEHFEVISKFRVRREDAAFSISNEADRRFLSRLCIKAGDIGHSALPWYLHTKWTANVLQEFYAQGEEEARLGLPVSPLCNRGELADVGKTQKGFLDFVCMPLFKVLAEEQEQSLKGGKVPENGAQGRKASRSQSVAASQMHLTHGVRGTVMDELKANAQRWVEDNAAVEEVKVLLEKQ